MTGRTSGGIRVLDWAISDTLAANPDNLARARVVVGAAQLYFVSALAMVLSAPSLGLPLVGTLVFVGCAVLYASVLYVIKRHGALRLGTLLLSITLTALLTLMSLQENGSNIAISVWTVAIPLLVTYTVNVRWGFVAALVLAPIFLGTWTLQYHGYSMDWFPWPAPSPLGVVFEVIALPLVTGFGALHRAARDRAQCQLEQTVDALTAQERKLVSVIETSGDLVLSVDCDLRFVHVNSRAKALIGRVQPVEIGRSFIDYIEPERRDIWRERFERATAEGKFRIEDRVVGPDGSDFWMDISIQPIIGTDCEGFTVYSQNITQRKRDEAELAALHRKLVSASRRAGMADVATTVLHNIGNVLSSADVATTQLTELAERGRCLDVARLRDLLPAEREDLVAFFRDDPRAEHVHPFISELADAIEKDRGDARAELGLLQRAVDHIRAIVRDQQDVARTGSMLEECRPAELLDTAVRLSGGGPVERVRIETSYGDVPAPLESDRHKVIQILANLVVNARDALKGREDPTIRLEIRHAEDQVRFTVTDNGTGIDPDVLVKIFQHGYTTKPNGHGFGLHSAANDAVELGGRLDAHSDGMGRGARFTLTLPLSPPERLRERFHQVCA